MRLQQARRANPYPWTWELPAAAVVAVLIVMIIAVHGARSIANATVGGGWQFTDRSALFASLPDILGGDSGAGLTSAAASPRYLWVWISATELATAVIIALTLRAALRRWGPGRVLGMASATAAAELLGEGRLRRNTAMIRPDLAQAGRSRAFEPKQVGWRLGVAAEPRTGRDLWVPWDRTVGVIGPQGSGKTLDLLVPALLGASGAALVTLTKVDDLLLTIDARAEHARPCVVLDPFGLAPGLPELVWDPIAGCVDPMVAERRAKAFTAGTVKEQSLVDTATTLLVSMRPRRPR